MLRTFVCAVLGLVICAGSLLAAEIKGKIKSVDADKGTLIVTVEDKDQDIKVTDDTKILNAAGKEIKDRLKYKGLKAGAEVIITKEGDKVTEVKLAGKKK